MKKESTSKCTSENKNTLTYSHHQKTRENNTGERGSKNKSDKFQYIAESFASDGAEFLHRSRGR